MAIANISWLRRWLHRLVCLTIIASPGAYAAGREASTNGDAELDIKGVVFALPAEELVSTMNGLEEAFNPRSRMSLKEVFRNQIKAEDLIQKASQIWLSFQNSTRESGTFLGLPRSDVVSVDIQFTIGNLKPFDCPDEKSRLESDRSTYSATAEGDWLALQTPNNKSVERFIFGKKNESPPFFETIVCDWSDRCTASKCLSQNLKVIFGFSRAVFKPNSWIALSENIRTAIDRIIVHKK